jgi:tetratricopeptide (TPR) repeat protein
VLADDERDADLAELAVTLARPLFFSGRIDEAMARNELALEMAESLVLPEVLAHGLSTKGLILSARGRHEEARLLLQHALDVALEHDLSSAALRAFNNLAATLITRDRIREGLDVCLRGRELGRKVGDRKTEAALGTWILGCLLLLGEWDAALAEERDDLDGLADHFRRFIGAFVPLYRGDVSEARHRVEALRPEVDVNETQNVATFRSVEAEVLLAEGDISQALAAAEEAIGLRDELASGLASVGGALVTAFEAAFIMGDEAKVDELLGLLERTAPGDLTPFLRATGARFGARRAALSSNGAAAAGFAAAADIFRQLEMPFDRALVLLEHAEWLAGENRAEETAALAAEAREIFERLRAVPYIDRLDLLPVEAAITAT